MTGDSGWIVVVVWPHACYPLAHSVVCRVFLRRMLNTQHGSRVESLEFQKHWKTGDEAMMTDVEKGVK